MTEILLKAEKLKKVFTAGKKSFAACGRGVHLKLKRGQMSWGSWVNQEAEKVQLPD